MSNRYSWATLAAAVSGLCLTLACEAPVSEMPEVGSSTQAVTLGYVPPSCTGGGTSFACGGREGPVAPDLAAACANDRWVGYQLSPLPSKCIKGRRTRAGRWKATKPFAALAQPNMPNELRRFCVYEWQPSAAYTGPAMVSLLPDVPSMRLERDCEAVSPLFTPGPSRSTIEAAQAAQLNLPEVGPAATFPTPTRTRVAIIDTSPTEVTTGLPSPGADGHGLVVGALARHVSCLRSAGAELDCAAQIMSYQGMPLGDQVASYGRPFDVALAMARAMDDWISSNTSDNLIINLSLGWDGRYGGRHGPDIRMTALAPWLVAQWAACEGALLIAAAGNRSQIGGANGPMFPGGWEQDARLCPGPANLYSPLVHAAGAVDGKDQTLRIARPGGNPRLLAPSAFATAAAPRPGGGYSRGKLVSGTSVSAANVTGTAALVWALDPNAGPDTIMEGIYRASVSFSDAPDFSNPQGQWMQARIDVCSAAARVCQPALQNCPLACSTRQVGVDAQVDYGLVFDLEYPGLRAGPVTPGASVSNFAAVPFENEASIEPHAGPQPGGTMCPLCGFDMDYLVGQLELTPDMQVHDIFVRPKPCSPGWCDPELGGFYIDIPDPTEFFKIDMAGVLDIGLLDSAMMEITTESKGEKIVRSAELFINP